MVLSDSFSKLWKDSAFRRRLTAVVVDEAHCIDEWGGDDFRPQYQKLDCLRAFTGKEVPFVACTATCQTSTFNTIWDTLGFGCRPFWGVDVGVDRPNLFFLIRALTNPKNPALDILNILPARLDPSTKLEDIPKTILYFDSESACRKAIETLRKCLPAHLRSAVHAFSSNLSVRAKEQCWENFANGTYRILCATDAAGMGCDVPDVVYIISFGCPKAFASVIQRWGRAGRDRITQGTCLLLVPPWAFQPDESLNPTLRRACGKATLTEPKSDTTKRANMDKKLEQFVNLHKSSHKCKSF